jgi:hypothetical protein
MLATTLTVIVSQSRHLVADKTCIMAVVIIGSVVYIKTRWLALLAIGFAAILLMAGIDILDSVYITDFLKYIAAHKIPAPRLFDMRDFIDNLEHQTYVQKINQEVLLYKYSFAAITVLTTCIIADYLLRPRSASGIAGDTHSTARRHGA